MTDKTYPSFQIIEFMGNSSVLGRNCGSEVSLDKIFTQIVRQDFIRLKHDSLRMTETMLAEDIVIELKGIQVASRDLAALPTGYTAQLELCGAGIDKLFSFREILSDDSYLAIESPCYARS